MRPATIVVAFVFALVLALVFGAAAPERATAQTAQAAPQPNKGTVITDTVWSQALGASKSLVVYLPPSYRSDRTRRFPVAYYLHGLGGDETDWTVAGRIGQVMDSLVAAGKPEMIIAMPDGDDSWYATYNVLLDAAGCRRMLRTGGNADHDCVAWPHYDDYIAFDVVRHMDGKYRTTAAATARAIAGLSMGGYGAFTLALQYPATFSAAASHSGVLSPMEFAPPPFGRGLFARSPADSATAASFGARNAERFRVIFGADSSSWRARDPAMIALRLAERLAARLAARLVARPDERGGKIPALYADGGTGDFFLAESRAFVAAVESQSVPVEYHEWPGGHDWVYWRAHVGESLAWIGARITAPVTR